MDKAKEFVEGIVRSIVDHPEDVKIKVVEGEKSTILELKVNPEDVSKVIGKGGRIARAIRTLIGVIAGRSNKRIILEILE
ncbi:MAG TPA: RNA-binding protein [Spirochaetia bacterium]|nr:MAG: RNA-binding protein [Spirochaetes bacterium GWB1_36_13]HCL55729.1 RNA-binding protein [Spirochaetia bacterium]